MQKNFTGKRVLIDDQKHLLGCNAGTVRPPGGDTLPCPVEERTYISRLCAARSESGIVFPCGQTIGLDGDTTHLYYGAADLCLAMATGSTRTLLA
jgi:hypothetical protein